MTECTERASIGKLGRRSIVSTFDGGAMTSDGGASLLALADHRLGLTDRIAACFEDPRDPGRINHSIHDLVRQRVFALAMGYEDLNDHNALRCDPLLRLLAGRAPEANDLASPSTLCRFENHSQPRLLTMMDALIDVFVASFGRKRPGEPIVLDIDASADPTHGDQERSFFNGFYDNHCFLPLFIFCGDHLLFSWLRPSSRSAAYNSRAAIAWIVKRLRQRWPDIEIIVRGDSGYGVPKILEWCDRHDVGYVLGFPKNSKLNGMIESHMTRAREECERTGEAARVYTSVKYQARSWSRPRRVVAKAEWLGDKANPRYVVTSVRGTAQGIYDEQYCARRHGESDQRTAVRPVL